MISYEIMINTNECPYNWRYNFGANKGIIICLGDNSAQILFDMKVKRTPLELVSFVTPLVRDAYRKVYQLHAVIYNKGLKVEKIRVKSGDEEMLFDPSNSNFPFLFSMIGAADLGLNDSWKALDDAIMSTTKTGKDSDFRFAAMFSYFASKSRQFEIDRFSNLWTAMNSYYSYVNRCYEKHLKNEYKVLEPGHLKKLYLSQEADLIGAALWQIDPRYTKFSKDEANEIWSGDYSIEKALSGYTEEDIEDLYEDLLQELTTKKLDPKHEVFKKRAEQFGLSSFTFMLFEYSYNWRCKLFHGNRCTLLFSAYNDYEIYVVKTINYFLDRFLNENIPHLFDEFFWNDEKQERMEKYILHIMDEKNAKKYNEILDQYK